MALSTSRNHHMTLKGKIMKTILVGTVLLAGLVFSGCANNRDSIVKASRATRNDIFAENAGLVDQSGKAITDIRFTVKSNSSRFEELYNKHSDPPYRVQVIVN